MTTKRGGPRPGAARPRKTPTPAATSADPQIFESAERYLLAVIKGETPADPVKVRAATCLIRYQTAVKRVPPVPPTPRQMERKEIAAADAVVAAEFEARAAEIRRRHKEKANDERG